MKQVLWLLLTLAVSACAPADPPDRGPQEITGACQRAFRPTLEAWEARYDRVPDKCAYLDREYPVQLVSADEMPCDDEPGTIVTGCSVLDDAIYLLEDRLPSQLVDTSVHEWTHLLAACVDGDIDAAHLRSDLWATYGNDTVEFDGQLNAEIGECL